LAVSATVFEILTLKATKSLNFSDPPLFQAPVRGEPLRIWWWNLASENKSLGATRQWRNHAASFLRFDTIPARDGRTERQTDRYVAIARA